MFQFGLGYIILMILKNKSEIKSTGCLHILKLQVLLVRLINLKSIEVNDNIYRVSSKWWYQFFLYIIWFLIEIDFWVSKFNSNWNWWFIIGQYDLSIVMVKFSCICLSFLTWRLFRRISFLLIKPFVVCTWLVSFLLAL